MAGLNIIGDKIQADGLVILGNCSNEAWCRFNDVIQSEIGDLLDLDYSNDQSIPADLNSRRLSTYRKLNEIDGWENLYFDLVSEPIQALLGVDLLIQRKLNLSVQLPQDTTSTLSMHADTMSGQSPFELVVWTAFTDVFGTNGMFYFDIETSRKIFFEMPEFEKSGLEALREKYWSQVKFIELKAGQVCIFSGTIFHGNVPNSTSSARVSINCRFKNIFSPSGTSASTDRSGGVFYKKLFESSVTRLAREYLSREIAF